MNEAPFGYKQELQRSLSVGDLILYGIVYMAPTAAFSLFGFIAEAANGMVALAYIVGAVAMAVSVWPRPS